MWGDAGVIIPFNWGSWDASHIWGAAALKGVLNQVSLSEERIFVVESPLDFVLAYYCGSLVLAKSR